MSNLISIVLSLILVILGIGLMMSATDIFGAIVGLAIVIWSILTFVCIFEGKEKQ